MAKLNFRYGTMNSGKSIDLMRVAHNYEENGYSIVVMKPKIDTKGKNMLDSRIGMRRKVDILIDSNTNIMEEIKNTKKDNLACIFVDEAQFLNKEQIDELFLITKILDIPVVCYGLRNNFKMEGFAGSDRLLEIAEEIVEIKTLCKCGNIARYVGRKVNDFYMLEGDVVLIDGKEDKVEYVPLCGNCYLNEVKKIDKVKVKSKYRI